MRLPSFEFQVLSFEIEADFVFVQISRFTATITINMRRVSLICLSSCNRLSNLLEVRGNSGASLSTAEKLADGGKRFDMITNDFENGQ
jgi:hypothetical protein